MKLVLAAACLGTLALVMSGAPPPPTIAPTQQTAAHVQVGPAPASPSAPAVRQRSVAPGLTDPQPGHPPFTLMRVSQFPSLGTAAQSGPVFRGGRRSLTSTSGSVTTPSGTRNTSAPLSPGLFNSLNKPGIAAGDNGSMPPSPPDSTGAIGPNNYVEMANSVVHVWGRDLSSVSSASFSTFIGTVDPWCDPQIQWNQAASRWLFVILLCNANNTNGTQGFAIGWSKTSDPSNLTTGWCVFVGGTPNGLIFDYPKLGHNANYLIVAGNFYNLGASLTNPPFVTAAVAWFTLPAAGDTTCSNPGFNATSLSSALLDGDQSTPAFTLVPVNSTTSTANGYIVSAYDAGGSVTANPTPQSKLAVWHLDSGGTLHQDPDISVNQYQRPTVAPQSGGFSIDTLDGRLTQAVGDPVTGIWTQHTVDPPGASVVSQVDWYELSMSGSSLTLTQQGAIVDGGGQSVFNAAISPSFSARGAAIFYNRSSSSTLPVIAAQIRVSATPLGAMELGETVLASGTAADADMTCNFGPQHFPCRWGDYSAASPDPLQPYVVWGTNEFNTAATSTPAWRDENFAVAAAIPPGAPTIVSASTGEDGFSCVRWTPSSSDTGATDLSYTIKAYQGVTVAASVVINAPATVGCVKGLTDGTTYALTVLATNVAGSGAESTPSSPVMPRRGAAPSSLAASSSRTSVNPAPAAPTPPPR